MTLKIGVYLEGQRIGEYKLPVKDGKEALMALKILVAQDKSFRMEEN